MLIADDLKPASTTLELASVDRQAVGAVAQAVVDFKAD